MKAPTLIELKFESEPLPEYILFINSSIVAGSNNLLLMMQEVTNELRRRKGQDIRLKIDLIAKVR